MDLLDKLLKNKQLVLFDGVCNFCNASVLKIIKKDTQNLFLFASLQSEIGKQITNHFKIDTKKTDSIILVTSKDNYYSKSSAALKIAKHFGRFWMLFQIFWILPKAFRDFFYDYIAKNRYKWFGKKESCMIPTPELKSKFLE
ncbi:thiol-disulfide oxidoreductase DCC family protein [Polaribacter uvawellassae]|uniref:thiol-disulfide oxidoreductase DCC family protein n=1 Tax=Polaribacter uvawellassae TaxID=3133495 RepID=UPI0032191726